MRSGPVSASRSATSLSAQARASQRGLSMVELLVGVAIGLFIAASAATLLASNLRENRNLLIESRLMQDLRTAADVVTRDLRRSGYWGAATDGIWTPGAVAVTANPYQALAPNHAASDVVSFRFSRDVTENNVVDSNEQFGFRLRRGAVELQLGDGNWQALTDPGTVVVTTFSVTPHTDSVSLAAMCALPCPAGGAASCPPTQQVRSLVVTIAGRAAADAAVNRSISTSVRLRNDPVSGACPV